MVCGNVEFLLIFLYQPSSTKRLEMVQMISKSELNKEFLEFMSSKLLQAAVQRKFEIIGEALNRIKSIDSEFIENITV